MDNWKCLLLNSSFWVQMSPDVLGWIINDHLRPMIISTCKQCYTNLRLSFSLCCIFFFKFTTFLEGSLELLPTDPSHTPPGWETVTETEIAGVYICVFPHQATNFAKREHYATPQSDSRKTGAATWRLFSALCTDISSRKVQIQTAAAAGELKLQKVGMTGCRVYYGVSCKLTVYFE